MTFLEALSQTPNFAVNPAQPLPKLTPEQLAANIGLVANSPTLAAPVVAPSVPVESPQLAPDLPGNFWNVINSNIRGERPSSLGQGTSIIGGLQPTPTPSVRGATNPARIGSTTNFGLAANAPAVGAEQMSPATLPSDIDELYAELLNNVRGMNQPQQIDPGVQAALSRMDDMMALLSKQDEVPQLKQYEPTLWDKIRWTIANTALGAGGHQITPYDQRVAMRTQMMNEPTLQQEGLENQQVQQMLQLTQAVGDRARLQAGAQMDAQTQQARRVSSLLDILGLRENSRLREEDMKSRGDMLGNAAMLEYMLNNSGGAPAQTVVPMNPPTQP